MCYDFVRFDGDTEALAAMIKDSWLHDLKKSKVTYDYTKEWLDWVLKGPGSDPDLQVMGVHSGEIVSFFCALPRRIHYGGSVWKGALGTLITVAVKHRRKGLAWKTSYSCRDRAIEKKYKLYYGFIYAGRASYEMAQEYREKGEDLIELMVGKTLIKPLIPADIQRAYKTSWPVNILAKWKSHIGPGDGRPAEKGDLKEILAMLNSYSDKVDFARIWDMDELKWHINSPFTSTLVHEAPDGSLDGVFSYSMIKLITPHGEMMTGELDAAYLPEDKKAAVALVYSALADARKRGIAIMSHIDFSYLDRKVLQSAGFINYGRKISMFSQSFNGPKLRKIKSAYTELR